MAMMVREGLTALLRRAGGVDDIEVAEVMGLAVRVEDARRGIVAHATSKR
jgi:predicted transcriptional regulator